MAAELKEPVVSRHPDDYIRNMKCLNVATQFVAISKGHLRDLAQPDNEMAALSPSAGSTSMKRIRRPARRLR